MDIFRRRLLMMEVGGEYSYLESIENTSDAYIDTGIIPNATTKSELDIEFTKNYPSGAFFAFGARASGGASSYTTLLLGGKIADDYFDWNDRKSFNSPIQARHKIIKDGNKITVNGVTQTHRTGNINPNASIYVFSVSESGSVLTGVQGKLYSLKIHKEGKLVRDFIPARRNSDNVVGLYDKIENKFYVSPNGTKFIGG